MRCGLGRITAVASLGISPFRNMEIWPRFRRRRTCFPALPARRPGKIVTIRTGGCVSGPDLFSDSKPPIANVYRAREHSVRPLRKCGTRLLALRRSNAARRPGAGRSCRPGFFERVKDIVGAVPAALDEPLVNDVQARVREDRLKLTLLVENDSPAAGPKRRESH